MSATAFDVDLVCAQFDFFTCGSPRGSLRLALRRRFFCRLVHNSSLGDSGLQEKAESESLLQATLTPCRRDLLGGATSRSSQQQQRPVSGELISWKRNDRIPRSGQPPRTQT